MLLDHLVWQIIRPVSEMAGMLKISMPDWPILYLGSLQLWVLSFLLFSFFLDITMDELFSMTLLKKEKSWLVLSADLDPILDIPVSPSQYSRANTVLLGALTWTLWQGWPQCHSHQCLGLLSCWAWGPLAPFTVRGARGRGAVLRR